MRERVDKLVGWNIRRHCLLRETVPGRDFYLCPVVLYPDSAELTGPGIGGFDADGDDLQAGVVKSEIDNFLKGDEVRN